MKRIKRILAAIIAVIMVPLFSSCIWDGLEMLRQEEAGIIVYNDVTYVNTRKGLSFPPYTFPFQASSDVSGIEIGYIPVFNLGAKAVMEQYNEDILIQRYGIMLYLWLREGYPEFSAIEDYTITNIEDRDCRNVDGKYELTANELISFDESITYFDLVEQENFFLYEDIEEEQSSPIFCRVNEVKDIDIAMMLNISIHKKILYLEYYEKTEESNKYLCTGYYKVKNKYQYLFKRLF